MSVVFSAWIVVDPAHKLRYEPNSERSTGFSCFCACSEVGASLPWHLYGGVADRGNYVVVLKRDIYCA